MSKTLGAAFEDRALEYLQRQGMRLVERNVAYRRGELDLIMRDAGGVLVFVEVRARAGAAFGGAAASVGAAKRRRLLWAAECYLAQLRTPRPPCRFDVVAFDAHRLTWFADAFGADP
jgi:putative endonuclease